MHKTNTIFRAWYYFRNGWSLYFAFIFAAVNTLTVTYFLAIENYPVLNALFPSFFHYILIVISIGIPILVGIGYLHFKKTTAYRTETEIMYETNPFGRRLAVNSEIMLALNLELINMIIRLSDNNKLSKEEIDKTKKIQNELKNFVENRTFANNNDLSFLKKMSKR